MTTLDPVYEALARRARTVAAFAWCGKALVAAGAVTLALSVAAVAASWSFPGMPGVVAGIALCGGVSGYFYGRSRPVNTTRSLFRADVGLGTEARLSTLHAIRDRRDLQPFALRIAAGLPSRPLLPRVGLPFPRRQVALAVGGALLVIAAVALAAASPSPRAGETRALEPVAGSAEARPGGPAVAPAETTAQRATLEGDRDGSQAQLSASSTSASSSPSEEETAMTGDDLTTRPQAAATLDEALAEIEGRMAGQDGGLTQSDVDTLEAFAETSTGPLAAAIRDLLSAPTGEQALAQVRALLANPASGAGDRARADDGNSSPSEELGRAASGPVAPDATAASRATASPGLSDVASNRGGVFPFFDDQMRGASTLELIGATLPSSIGETGEYSYYITKSVPVEPPAGIPTPAGVPRSLSFEQASSIAAGRALPTDVLDAVRDYFTKITEGGS